MDTRSKQQEVILKWTVTQRLILTFYHLLVTLVLDRIRRNHRRKRGHYLFEIYLSIDSPFYLSFYDSISVVGSVNQPAGAPLSELDANESRFIYEPKIAESAPKSKGSMFVS